MINQSLSNGSINQSIQCLSGGCICCDVYKLHGLIMYEMDDIIKATYISKCNHHYNCDTTEFNECYLMIKHITMNRIGCNIINNKKQYVILSLICVFVLYEMIWVIVSMLRVVIATKHLDRHYCIIYDYQYKQNIKSKTFLSVFITMKDTISVGLLRAYYWYRNTTQLEIIIETTRDKQIASRNDNLPLHVPKILCRGDGHKMYTVNLLKT